MEQNSFTFPGVGVDFHISSLQLKKKKRKKKKDEDEKRQLRHQTCPLGQQHRESP